MLKKLWDKRKDKKGFTLVELIVVLIILAILAALLIPALTGYIDKAKEKQIIAETRQAVMAAQTLADEVYAKGQKPAYVSAATMPTPVREDGVYSCEIQDLADVPGTVTALTFDDTDIAKVKTLVYRNKAGKTCQYSLKDGSDTGTFTIPAPTP